MESKEAHNEYSANSFDLNVEPPSPLQRLVVTVGDDHRIGRDGDRDEEAQAPYACSYCDRRFFSQQALGGHQNAHRLGGDAGTRRRQVAPPSPEPAPAPAVHTGGELLETYDPASVVAAPVVDWTLAWGHDIGEAAATPTPAPGLDLSLKLWSG